MASAGGKLVDRPVTVTSSHGKELAANLRVLAWTDEERQTRVMKRLAMWWAGALGFAVVPPHFPWLTIGLVGGPIAAWLASRQGAMVQSQDVKCPDCGTPAHIDEQPESWPIGARCETCRTVFWISPADAEKT
jgi:hypothetical protein